MRFHEAPASTAVRNASTNLPHVHRPEARYPDMINVNGGGPFIHAPSGPRMLHRPDDRQMTNNNAETEVLTLVSNLDSGTTMAEESVTPVHDVDDIHIIVKRKNRNDEKRVENDTISESVGDYHRRNRSSSSSSSSQKFLEWPKQHDAGNRTPLGYGTRAHVMQTRSSDDNSVSPSVRPSVCHTREL